MEALMSRRNTRHQNHYQRRWTAEVFLVAIPGSRFAQRPDVVFVLIILIGAFALVGVVTNAIQLIRIYFLPISFVCYILCKDLKRKDKWGRCFYS